MTRFERELRALIDRKIEKLERRVIGIAARIVIEAVSNGTKLQTAKGTASAKETDDDIEVFAQGGVIHVPLAGAEGVVLSIGGRSEGRVVLGLSNRDARPTDSQPGETGLYTAGSLAGTKILCRADGEVILTPQSKVRIVGDLHVTGEVVAKCDTTAVFVTQISVPSPMGPLGPPIPMPPVPPDLAIP